MSPQVYKTPELQPIEGEVLSLIAELREQLRFRVAEKPRRWAGQLRRMAFARAVQASNSIEGYDASLDDVVAAIDDEPTLSAGEETRLALGGYRDAMTYVLQIAGDPQVGVDEGLLKSLHFMMLKHHLEKNPGRWRPGAIYVRREPTGEIVYQGPDSDRVPELVSAAISELETSDAPVLVRAAMAHLNLVMIHPFSDGNGRMARCLQTLTLAREQIVAPVFSSIEEHLGRNTRAYYEILAEVGQGGWNPQYDARPWVRFCLTAHYHQARTQVRRIEETERLYVACCDLADKHGLPERAAGALGDAALGLRLRRASYRAVVKITQAEEVSDLTASRDLRAIVDAGLFKPIGQARGRYYLAEPPLRDLYDRIRADRAPKETADPFDLALGQLELDVTSA
jgi:Fic family protein